MYMEYIWWDVIYASENEDRVTIHTNPYYIAYLICIYVRM